ncbi:hypothetical protein ILUMI_24746 [Ignelater luminosus]|uniref:Reverse transcriptase RNase H-like domain-containing protein n=1 Tax=Ignelater luminosus TaxID=2038154 RepID=A0A8K0C6L0_IGNLU|nr:hypothetical protein ILUMI_24746 [Ignelater luminosus]
MEADILTGSKQSVAGHTLYEILKRKGHRFEFMGCHFKLADGKPRYEDVLAIYVDVYLHSRRIPTKFFVFPTATCINTLLGMDFVEDAWLAFNFENKTWSFADDSGILYSLQYEAPKPDSDSSIDINFITSLRPDEGQSLEEAEKQKHIIETGNHPPISIPPYRMSPARKEILRQELDKLLQQEIIEECGSASAPETGCREASDSRLLTTSERNDSCPEREALAIVFALQQFGGYIEGSEILVTSDHQGFRYFNVKIDYLPGRRNVVADTLSRPPFPKLPPGEEIPICMVAVTVPGGSQQLEDFELAKIIHSFKSSDDSDLPK